MKNLTYIIILFIGLSVNAQNVGINTDSPSQTLDIEGSLRVETIPNGNRQTIPLSWNPNTETTNPGKIIAGFDNNDKPFKLLKYKITVGDNNEDYVNDIDLGYSTDDYTLILLDHVLLHPDGYPVFMQVQGTSNGKDAVPAFLGSKTIRGVVRETKNGSSEDKGEAGMKTMNNRYLAVASPIIMTYPKGGSWHFYADYPGAAPVSFRYDTSSANSLKVVEGTDDLPSRISNISYIWNVTFLLIKKTFAPHEIKNINQP